MTPVFRARRDNIAPRTTIPVVHESEEKPVGDGHGAPKSETGWGQCAALAASHSLVTGFKNKPWAPLCGSSIFTAQY